MTTYEVLINGLWQSVDKAVELKFTERGKLAWQIDYPDGMYDTGIANEGEWRRNSNVLVIPPKRIAN